MIFSPYDCTKEEARQGVVRTQSRDTLIGKVAKREIIECFKTNRYGK